MRILAAAATLGTALILSAAGHAQDQGSATGTFINTDGVEVGTVSLMSMDGGVHITGEVMGIPEGEHGFHFHMVGDCDAAGGFESAGSHFNPTDMQHGLENPEGPHAGDMTSVTADADGMVSIDVMNDMASLIEGEEGYLFDEDGTSLMIHAMPDDQMTDPSGNSGDRIACAVIEANTQP